jgi:16S rRNA (guanine966-N2)-methyltransferase
VNVGSLRIIAGSLKGRKVPVPESNGLRPTPDRVREALFSILGGVVDGARVLDAYAGSGALGLEAYSRGAAAVTFLEADRQVHLALVRTLGDLGVSDRCRALLGRAEQLPAGVRDGSPYDLVLADPPYAMQAAGAVLRWASTPGLLSAGGSLVLERKAADPPVAGDGPFRQVRTARYGRIALDFYTA